MNEYKSYVQLIQGYFIANFLNEFTSYFNSKNSYIKLSFVYFDIGVTTLGELGTLWEVIIVNDWMGLDLCETVLCIVMKFHNNYNKKPHTITSL